MVSIIDKNEDTKPFSVDRGRLCQIPTPKPTLSWCPLPHARLMDSVEDQLRKRGYRVHDSTCLLTHGGNRFLGTVSISNRENLGYRRMIGARKELEVGSVKTGSRNSGGGASINDFEFKVQDGLGSGAEELEIYYRDQLLKHERIRNYVIDLDGGFRRKVK